MTLIPGHGFSCYVNLEIAFNQSLFLLEGRYLNHGQFACFRKHLLHTCQKFGLRRQNISLLKPA